MLSVRATRAAASLVVADERDAGGGSASDNRYIDGRGAGTGNAESVRIPDRSATSLTLS